MVFTSLFFHARSKLFLGWALITLALLVAACSRSNVNSGANSGNRGGRGEGGAGRGGVEVPAIPVTTARAVVREIPTTIEATGSLTATESSDVASQASGQVISTPVGVG